ncbi:MAG: DUF484 family protein [Gammaproteobacteria bacterium]|nr:DUF484 family protein [Gammaproteobacteria bacterium]MCP5138056.1 DUF484 family protein [Gammaproteobacteria bacterium]
MSKAPKNAKIEPDSTPLDTAQVVEFLGANPGFLHDHPALLERLDLSHPVAGGAVSLIERQTRVLRERNAALQARIDEQLDAARYNEQLHARLHELCLSLFPATSLAARIAAIQTHVGKLGGDVLGLKLFGDARLIPEANRADREHLDFQRHFGSFLKARSPLCGRLQRGQLELLFGDQAAEVQSAALTPLGVDGSVGILAIGSHDPARFQAHLGTDFLRQLGETVGQALWVATQPE